MQILPDLASPEGEQTIMDYDKNGVVVAKEAKVRGYEVSDVLGLAIAKIQQLEERIKVLERK